MKFETSLFVGFSVKPSDFLREVTNEWIVDCGHDPDEEQVYCDECGQQVRRSESDVELRDDYLDKLKDPKYEISDLDDEVVYEWMEWDAFSLIDDSIRAGRSFNPQESTKQAVVGIEVADVNLTFGLPEIHSLSLSRFQEISKKVKDFMNELDLDRQIGVHLIERVSE